MMISYDDFIDSIVCFLRKKYRVDMQKQSATWECGFDQNCNYKITVYSGLNTLAAMYIKSNYINVYYKCCDLHGLPEALFLLDGIMFKCKRYNIEEFDLDEITYYLDIITLLRDCRG